MTNGNHVLFQIFTLTLTLQLLDPLGFRCGDTLARAHVNFCVFDPFVQRLGYTANLWSDGFDGGPQRWEPACTRYAQSGADGCGTEVALQAG